MMDGILNIVGSIAQIVAEWPERQAKKAKKKYANWRAGFELRKDVRRRRGDLIDSTDRILLDNKNKLP